MTNPILDGLNPTQRKAAEILTGPLLILAGAGSGKTKTLTHRIANLIATGVDPSSILAVTFTNKAAKEMKERVQKLIFDLSSNSPDFELDFQMPTMGTFHSICVQMLREDIDVLETKLNRNFVIFDSDDQQKLIKKIMKDLGFETSDFNPKGVASIISGAKNKLKTPSEFSANFSRNPIYSAVETIFPRYQAELEKHNALDFDDLIQKTVQVLEKSSEILQKYRTRWQHLLVDEYQDVNFAQYRLVRLLTGQEENLCVIGDDHQSIYAFRGADYSNILNFSRDFPQAKVIKLEQNYRSTKNILANANSLISYNETGQQKNLWTENEEGEKVFINELESDREEGNTIAQKILAKFNEGADYQDFAILYRMNAQSRSIEEALMRNQIPYQIVGGTRFFDRKEIKDVLAYLRLILNPNDDLSFLRIINFPSRKIGASTISVLQKFAGNYNMSLFAILEHVEEINSLSDSKKKVLADFYKMMTDISQKIKEPPQSELKERQNISVSEILKRVLNKTQILETLDDGTSEGESRAQNVREIFSVASRYENAENSLSAFLEGVALVADIDNLEQKKAVTLMTIHSSKGLEFPYVFLPGWEEGIFPPSRSMKSQEDIEEERRLGYVAITRAQKKCEILSTKRRLLFGSFQYARPSQFLTELDDKCCFRDESNSGALSERKNFAGFSNKYSPSVKSKGFKIMKKTPKTREEAIFGIAENETDFQISDRVRHKSFGEGTIIQINGDILTIAFAGKGLKKLSASVAPIEKI